ncbi:Thioredoxin-2 [Hartmannibacter diazotrophicus]|uniref:Thioredoxin n=1 Tax=Hartmannibacter diazotrophicus TaxID=1482074 RepID=A0A2C9D392_9HYPH|nr:thioredoxin TrxC [Hartmannibacter diazotrophicus]SON54772.1 Thioredoxin-2 [Hartmannibacter diazotrophicus]
MPVHVVCPTCSTVNRLSEERLQSDWKAAKCPKCGGPLFPAKPVDVSAPVLSRHVERSDLPVVVDFWAAWCGPCKMMAPHFAEAAGQLASKARFLKVNTEEAPELSGSLGIRSIPTMVLFRNGREVARQAGAMGSGQIVRWVMDHAG